MNGSFIELSLLWHCLRILRRYSVHNELWSDGHHVKMYSISPNYACGTYFLCLLWFRLRRFYPYSSELLHWHWGKHAIVPIPMKKLRKLIIYIWTTMSWWKASIKRSTSNPCAYSMGYTVTLYALYILVHGCNYVWFCDIVCLLTL